MRAVARLPRHRRASRRRTGRGSPARMEKPTRGGPPKCEGRDHAGRRYTAATDAKRAVPRPATAIVLVLAGTAVWRLGIYDSIRHGARARGGTARARAACSRRRPTPRPAKPTSRARTSGRKDPQVAPVGEPDWRDAALSSPGRRLEDMPDRAVGRVGSARPPDPFVNTQTNAARTSSARHELRELPH